MSEQAPQPAVQQAQITRIFEQGPEAVSLYSDFAQVMGTGSEVVLQFYETIPGPPGPGGHAQMVKSRLRATITLSHTHAAAIGELLTRNAQAVSARLGTQS